MTHPRGRSISLVVALVVFAALQAPAQETVSITVAARFGAFYGVGNEYVYAPSISPGYVISQLVWPLAPMVYSGGALSLSLPQGIFVTVDVRQGFAGAAGSMTDSDFLNGDGVRTNFSQSTSYAERANLLDVRAGWDFYRARTLRVGAFAAFSYMDLKWSARDGYYQYPPQSSPPFTPWSSSETKVPLYGTGIVYETAYGGGSIGARIAWAFTDAFALDGSFAFTPILGCSTEDNHLMRQLDFYSTLTGGFMIEPRVAVTYSFTPRARLRLEVGYRYAWNLKGDLTSVNTGASDYSTTFPYAAGPDSTSTETGASGADFSALDAGLVLSISW